MRQIIYFPGSETIPGYPSLDVTENEISVANIDKLRHWPGLFEWDVASKLILDRMTDQPISTIGSVDPSQNFFTMSNGKKGYKVQTVNSALQMAFDTSGSFTIGVVAGKDLAFGSTSVTASTTSSPTSWGLYSAFDGSGSIALAFGDVNVQNSASSLWPKSLTDASLTAVVLIFDRAAGKMSLRYNGVEMWSSSSASIKTMVLSPEMSLGGIRVAGSGAVLSSRQVTTNAFVAIEKALSGDDLTSLENMLAESASSV